LPRQKIKVKRQKKNVERIEDPDQRVGSVDPDRIADPDRSVRSEDPDHRVGNKSTERRSFVFMGREVLRRKGVKVFVQSAFGLSIKR